MKKWLPAFLFLSLSGCNDALAANQSTMFYSFNDNIYRPQLSVKVTDIVQFIVDINSASSTATLSYVACNGFTWTHGLTGLSILHGWLFLNMFPIMDIIYILNFSPEEVFHLMQKIMIITILPRDLHGMK